MKLIVTYCKSRGISLNNKIPWNFKSYLPYFNNLTIGNCNNAVIMGNKTWQSIGSKSLPKRTNIILTRKKNTRISPPEKINEKRPRIFMNSFQETIDFCQRKKFDDIWVIGGSNLYNYTMLNNYIKEVHVAFVNNEFICDSVFNPLPPQFTLVQQSNYHQDNEILYRHLVYKNHKL